MPKGNPHRYPEHMRTYDDHAAWIASLTPGATTGQAERLIGASNGALGKFMARNHGRLSADYVIRVATAYGKNPLVGLVQTGHVGEEHLPKGVAASNDELLDELRRRLI